MAQTRDILGKVFIETADRKRRCHHKSSHSIAAGERCLVIKGALPNEKKNYCHLCAVDILKKATGRLSELRSIFGI